MIDFPLLALFFVAVLYSSVGLAGGSSYTVFMAIPVPLPTIPSISLSLNTLVSSIAASISIAIAILNTVVATDSTDRFAVCLCGQSHTVASKGVLCRAISHAVI